MKLATGGIRYNTDRAKLVASYATDNWSANLMKTPTAGHYFLHGRGDIMSVFRGRERIIPLSEDEAMAWLERYFD